MIVKLFVNQKSEIALKDSKFQLEKIEQDMER